MRLSDLRSRSLFFAVLAAALLGAHSGAAAAVITEEGDGATYVAAAGEVNQVTVSLPTASTIHFIGTGAASG